MWTAFAATVGGSAAGLTGLTFIVVAFRFEVVAVSQEYRNRAAQVLTIFVTIILTAALLTIPQPRFALGIELMVAAVCSATLLLVLDAAARRGAEARRHWILTVALTLFATGMALGGLLCVADSSHGLDFYAASALLGLAWGAYGAWIFLTQAGLPSASTNEPAQEPA